MKQVMKSLRRGDRTSRTGKAAMLDQLGSSFLSGIATKATHSEQKLIE